MAVESGENGGRFTLSDGAMTTNVTLPTEQLCHYIRDDELDSITEFGREPIAEICLLAAGSALGSLIPAINGIARWYTSDSAMSAASLVALLQFVASIAVTLVTGYLWRRRRGVKQSLVDEIKGRPKIPMRVVHSERTITPQ